MRLCNENFFMRTCIEKIILKSQTERTKQTKYNNKPTNENFPVLAGLCHLVGTPHLGVSHAPYHKYD